MPRVYSTAAFCWGALVGVLTYAVGGIDVAVQWLFAFVVVDYLLGVAAACKTHVWSSSTGFKGIVKKAVIFSVVCVGNGLDQVLGTGGTLRNAAIAAYCVNEAGSILENLGRLGYTGLIPVKIKNAIKEINESEEDKK
ncbi:MAG: phage holin family protein [Peptococcaceae bacterium]|nr:phage holin family protein [Peptococcaceae bacterium]